MKFKKLTPNYNIDITTYEESLDFAFKNDDVNNIALSGNYGAGKSSVIGAYENRHKERKYVHISLAHFQPVEELEQENDEKTNINILEGKILNQLIYQIDSKILQKTNFKVREDWTFVDIIKTFPIVFIVVIGFLYTWNFDEYTKMIKGIELLAFTIHPLFRLVVSVIVAVLSVYIVIKTHLVKNLFNKVKLEGNEIDLSCDNNISCFDKYLNEIIFLFDTSEIDAVVFEDIDRFDITKIFSRLREINSLINSRRAAKKEKRLKFFYLLKDDIFKDNKDRTKFFDFIIPIVPVLDGSNSFNKIIEYFDGKGLDEEFLSSVSLYVDDMRLLNNVYNEFEIYGKRIDCINLDKNKLLAIILYKNIFPDDFSELQMNKGYVYSVFDRKNRIVQDKVNDKNSQLIEIGEKRIALKNEYLEKIEEFNDLIAYYESKRCYNNNYYLTKKKNIEARKERFSALGGSEKDRQIANLDMKEKLIEKEIDDLKIAKLKDVIDKDNADTVFEKNGDITKNAYFPLVKFLIRNGWIDETYKDYVTYFYNNYISINDKRFMRMVMDEVGITYNFVIDDPYKVLSLLPVHTFKQDEMLNYCMFNALINNDDVKVCECRKVMFEKLAQDGNVKFIVEFYNNEFNLNKSYLMEAIFRNWKSFFATMLGMSDISEKDKENIIVDAISVYNVELKNIDIDGCISKYLTYDSKVYNRSDLNIVNVIGYLNECNIKIKSLDSDNVDKDILQNVFTNNCYALSWNNIVLMLKTFYVSVEEDVFMKPSSIILTDKDKPMYSYVNENINEYMEAILSGEEVFDDDESVVLELLNNENVSLENKGIYISKLHEGVTKISDINRVVTKALWSKLIAKNIVLNDAKNLIACFVKNGEIGADELNLIDAKGNEVYDFKWLKTKEFEDVWSKFFVAIVKCNDVCNEQYRNILKNLNRHYTKFTLEGISADKISILIDINVIRMDFDTFEFIKANYSDNLKEFILKNREAFVQLCIDSGELIDEEAGIYLLDEDISDELKIELLKLNNVKVSVKDRGLSDKVLSYILNNRFVDEELEYLIQHYFGYSDEIKESVLQKVSRNIEVLVDRVSTNKLFIKEFMKSNNINNDVKLEFLAKVQYSLDDSELKSCFELAGFVEWVSIFNYKNPRIKASEEAEVILRGLKERKIVSSYSKENEYYKVNSKRSR